MTARLGNAKVLDTLIMNGRVEALQDQGLEAARRGDLDTLHELIASGWDPNLATDRHGSSALLWAAGAGQLAACRFLVEQAGVDPITTAQAGRRAYHGRTALHWAARNGHVDIIRYLVSRTKGVPVDARASEGTTVCIGACWKGHLNAMRWLAENGKMFAWCSKHIWVQCSYVVVQEKANIDAVNMYIRSGVSFRLQTETVTVQYIKLLNVDDETFVLGYWDGNGDLTRKQRDRKGMKLGAPPNRFGTFESGQRRVPTSDLARLADNQSLQEWLQMRQNEVLLLDTVDKHSLRGDHGEGVRVGSVIETMYPPVTFFGAA